jgi:predicted acylesterase/phospholipase RssA
MRTLSEQSIPNMPEQHKLALFEQAERIYGRPALMLSGGAAFGIYHLGVTKALWEANLLPTILAGSSMGAIVAAAVCNRSDAELDTLFSEQMESIHHRALRWRSPKQMWQQQVRLWMNAKYLSILLPMLVARHLVKLISVVVEFLIFRFRQPVLIKNHVY